MILGQGKIEELIRYIEAKYVDEVDREKLIDEAITGVLQQLDPHSSYISAQELRQVNEQLEGNFEGIGIQFRIEKDTIMVIQTTAKGPSEKVGLLAGDRIVMIDDTLVAGIGIENRDAVGKLKGKRGTQVKVSVHRRRVTGLIDFNITRDVIPTYSVDIAYMVDGKTG